MADEHRSVPESPELLARPPDAGFGLAAGGQESVDLDHFRGSSSGIALVGADAHPGEVVVVVRETDFELSSVGSDRGTGVGVHPESFAGAGCGAAVAAGVRRLLGRVSVHDGQSCV